MSQSQWHARPRASNSEKWNGPFRLGPSGTPSSRQPWDPWDPPPMGPPENLPPHPKPTHHPWDPHTWDPHPPPLGPSWNPHPWDPHPPTRGTHTHMGPAPTPYPPMGPPLGPPSTHGTPTTPQTGIRVSLFYLHLRRLLRMHAASAREKAQQLYGLQSTQPSQEKIGLRLGKS